MIVTVVETEDQLLCWLVIHKHDVPRHGVKNIFPKAAIAFILKVTKVAADDDIARINVAICDAFSIW